VLHGSTLTLVILSEVAASRSGAATQSKDPYSVDTLQQRIKTFGEINGLNALVEIPCRGRRAVERV